MNANYILNEMFSKENMKYHCADINSKAMIVFNAAGFASLFSRPIIRIKKITVDYLSLVNCHSFNCTKQNEKVDVLALITDDSTDNMVNGLSIKEVLEFAKSIDPELEIVNVDKDYDGREWVCGVINIFDGTNNDECDRKNIDPEYKGFITDFII